ncbi:flagellar basal body rod protein FlgB [Bacillus massiliigorillae]|uniref:flagellar basal body rod protein FlgB n=1 Tax=Bacillus massiliigorillae TaxID=1243664 RepID=UPI0003A964EF|nr:flagellar basal body rod protein FlgB [Bacillus massiliigorillae]
MALISGTINLLEQAMNYSATKQKVISDNIANSDTPNYKAKSVSFSKMLETEKQNSFVANRTDRRHFNLTLSNQSSSGVYVNQNVAYNHNGNSVDVDKEMSDLATNTIYYNALTDRIIGKFQSLENVIKGGK